MSSHPIPQPSPTPGASPPAAPAGPSFHEELNTAQHCLEALARSVARLEQHLGRRPAQRAGRAAGTGTALEMRRVRSDTDHLRESLALLRAAVPAHPPPARPEMVTIPEQPYDTVLWADADEEGLGARHRHAP